MSREKSELFFALMDVFCQRMSTGHPKMAAEDVKTAAGLFGKKTLGAEFICRVAADILARPDEPIDPDDGKDLTTLDMPDSDDYVGSDGQEHSRHR